MEKGLGKIQMLDLCSKMVQSGKQNHLVPQEPKLAKLFSTHH